jgi:complex III assembly factor LYRM7
MKEATVRLGQRKHLLLAYSSIANIGRLELRIHEHTERGNNEDIKKGNGNNTLSGVKCCSS